ncbi:5'/3'-nucleotidase SurE [Soehngenia longivitae]|uniref:5'-nucleotidase SurE n=1 Tax=Soehngenia longivitae TaxID=2562294 RepID=A0A4Z0D8Z4_9FIRM|nr:5'/3'-nucleotidase SurE [Soehngenia longivitae]TFZ41325.1 5'/3'-nucleotidase SurE [Soehngenia longivitae]
MRILLTNDDGIFAKGLYTMAKKLSKEHEIMIVAPDVERSGQSHTITFLDSLIIKEVKLEDLETKAYSTSGTPADCVRIGMQLFKKENIDLVISGINMGANTGTDILYSGTVSAAIEANLFGIPSIAVSAEWTEGKVNYEIAAEYALKLVEKLKQFSFAPMVLNLNTPFKLKEDLAQMKICKIGGPIYDFYSTHHNGNGEIIYKAIGRDDSEKVMGTDRYYLHNGYPTLTPLKYDFTNFDAIKQLEELIVNSI